MKIIFLSFVPVCLPRIITLAFLCVFPPPPPFILIASFVMFFFSFSKFCFSPALSSLLIFCFSSSLFPSTAYLLLLIVTFHEPSVFLLIGDLYCPCSFPADATELWQMRNRSIANRTHKCTCRFATGYLAGFGIGTLLFRHKIRWNVKNRGCICYLPALSSLTLGLRPFGIGVSCRRFATTYKSHLQGSSLTLEDEACMGSVKMTIYPVLRLRTHGALPPLSHTFSWRDL